MLSLALMVLAAAPSATVTFAGDVTLGAHVDEYARTLIAKGVEPDEATVWGFAKTRDATRKADLFVVNLECPFTTSSDTLAKNFNFKARPQMVAALLSGGVDVVSLANNHLMDFQAAGLFDTLSTLDMYGLAHFGAGRNLAEARAPAIVTKNGIRFAFVGYFFLGDRNIEPREVYATVTTPGVAGDFSDLAAMRAMLAADIEAAKSKADHVIVFFHWGRESHGEIEAYQRELGHHAVDSGASAVVGSHPHVLQGIEVYKGATIAYSLGNYVFGGNWDPKDKRTALLNLTFSKTALTQSTVTPAMTDSYPEVPVQPYFPEDGGAVLSHLSELSSGFEKTLPSLTVTSPFAAP